jgi:membrane carboxypeptidase/penicillin-binding protein
MHLTFRQQIKVRALLGPTLLAVGLLSFLALSLFVAWILQPISGDVAGAVRQSSQSLQISSQIKDIQGLDIGVFSDQARYVVPIKQVPRHVQRAFIAAEDDRFWKHKGVSLKGMLRAAVANLKRDRFAQGGSTITQQLVRQLLLPREKTIFRKAREIVLAAALEQQMTKKEILELWLNSVYLGNNSWGVEAAARHYFNKHVDRLTVAEAAMLAGLPQAPSAYAPHLRPKLARKRQLYVLKRMLKLGWLDETRYTAALKTKLQVTKRREEVVEQAPWITEMTRIELWRRLEQKNLPSSGLVINTTINKDWQLDLQSLVRSSFHSVAQDDLEIAILVLDAKSGAIRSLIGGSDFQRSQFNRVVDLNRPFGASIYPLLFVWGMEKGLMNIHGYSSIAEAAVKSRFGEAEQIAPELGYGIVREKLSDWGLKVNEAMAIDELKGSPLDLARTYLRMSEGGQKGAQTNGLIASVHGGGKVLYQQTPETATPTTSENFAWVIRQWMALGSQADSRLLAGQPILKSIKGWNAWWVIDRSDVIITAWLGAERGEPKTPESLKQNDMAMDLVLSKWMSKNLSPSAMGPAPEGISYHISPSSTGLRIMRLPIVVPSSGAL